MHREMTAVDIVVRSSLNTTSVLSPVTVFNDSVLCIQMFHIHCSIIQLSVYGKCLVKFMLESFAEKQS